VRQSRHEKDRRSAVDSSGFSACDLMQGSIARPPPGIRSLISGTPYGRNVAFLAFPLQGARTRNCSKSYDRRERRMNAPSHRVFVGRIEIGAAWSKQSNEGRNYLGLKLDDPSFTAPLYANLVEDEDGKALSLNRLHDQPCFELPPFEIILRLALQIFGYRIQNHRHAPQYLERQNLFRWSTYGYARKFATCSIQAIIGCKIC
jgi:hypothetical protein